MNVVKALIRCEVALIFLKPFFREFTLKFITLSNDESRNGVKNMSVLKSESGFQFSDFPAE